jgi:hypothetical protein
MLVHRAFVASDNVAGSHRTDIGLSGIRPDTSEYRTTPDEGEQRAGSLRPGTQPRSGTAGGGSEINPGVEVSEINPGASGTVRAATLTLTVYTVTVSIDPMKSAAYLWSRLADVAGLVATPLAPSHYVELLRPLCDAHPPGSGRGGVRRDRGHSDADAASGAAVAGRQHVRVGVAVDGRIATRTFRSSSPDRRDGCITITVKARVASRALVRR